MFLVDTSPSMGAIRTVNLPPGPNGEEQTTDMTSLEWALQFVKLKIQEMVSISKPSVYHLPPTTYLRYTTDERPINVALYSLALKVRL